MGRYSQLGDGSHSFPMTPLPRWGRKRFIFLLPPPRMRAVALFFLTFSPQAGSGGESDR